VNNPYAYTPVADLSDERPDISRTSLARLIRKWLNEEIESKEFEDLLEAFEDSPARAVEMVATDINWGIMANDLEPRTLDRNSWNLIQRYLLLLDSGFEVHTQSKVYLTGRQPRALAALIVGAVIAWLLPSGTSQIWMLSPFWLSSNWLQRRWPVRNRLKQPLDDVILPFHSMYDLHEARRTTPRFQKQRWPNAANVTDGDSGYLSDFTSGLLLQVIWFFCSPVVLALQAFPHHDTREFARAAELLRR